MTKEQRQKVLAKLHFFDTVKTRFHTNTDAGSEGKIYRWARLASHKITVRFKKLQQIDEALKNHPRCDSTSKWFLDGLQKDLLSLRDRLKKELGLC